MRRCLAWVVDWLSARWAAAHPPVRPPTEDEQARAAWERSVLEARVRLLEEEAARRKAARTWERPHA